MLDILCQLPCPCGSEETVKKYINTKVQGKSDALGNLIVSKSDDIMFFCNMDEDAFTVMSIDGNKAYVCHKGESNVPLGSLISFGGYTGVLQAENPEKPTENLYVEMLKEGFEGVGMSGTVCVDYTTEDEIIFTKDAADKIALSSMLECATTEDKGTFVFGVQSKIGGKGATAVSRALKPDFVVAFEKTSEKTLTYKSATKGFLISEYAKEKIQSICEKKGIEIKTEVDTKAPSVASCFESPDVVVIGIPVRFSNQIRQAADVKYVEIVKNIIKAFLEEGK